MDNIIGANVPYDDDVYSYRKLGYWGQISDEFADV